MPGEHRVAGRARHEWGPILSFLLERRRLLIEWRRLVESLACTASRLAPGSRVYAAGSTVRGDWVAASDIDVIVVLPGDKPLKPREKAELEEALLEEARIPVEAPVELHTYTAAEWAKTRHRYEPLIEVECPQGG